MRVVRQGLHGIAAPPATLPRTSERNVTWVPGTTPFLPLISATYLQYRAASHGLAPPCQGQRISAPVLVRRVVEHRDGVPFLRPPPMPSHLCALPAPPPLLASLHLCFQRHTNPRLATGSLGHITNLETQLVWMSCFEAHFAHRSTRRGHLARGGIDAWDAVLDLSTMQRRLRVSGMETGGETQSAGPRMRRGSQSCSWATRCSA